ncbi:MAG: hypothetical protein D3912_04240, partial [Candidatus Electrothrix sp. AX1]|nr:hypothetical protein [Candidatus Electrothrix sp. AX1]
GEQIDVAFFGGHDFGGWRIDWVLYLNYYRNAVQSADSFHFGQAFLNSVPYFLSSLNGFRL